MALNLTDRYIEQQVGGNDAGPTFGMVQNPNFGRGANESTLLTQARDAVGQTGIYNHFDPAGGGNTWTIVKGKLFDWGGGSVPDDIRAAYPAATEQEKSSIMDPDSPENNADGSFGEGLLSMGSFLASAYGLGGLMQGLGTGAGAASSAGLGGTGGTFGGLEALSAAQPGLYGMEAANAAAAGANLTGGNMFDDYYPDFPTDGGSEYYPDFPTGEGFDYPDMNSEIQIGEKMAKTPGLLDRLNRALGTNITGSDIKTGLSAGNTLAKLFGWGGTAGSFMDLLGKAVPGLIGAYGATQQGAALERIANQARADRAPYLTKANEWLTGGPEAYAAGPGAGALRGVLAQFSASGGNPIGSGTALSLASQAGLADWRQGVTGMANIGLGGNQALLDTQAAIAGSPWQGLGRAASDVFAPQNERNWWERADGSNIFDTVT